MQLVDIDKESEYLVELRNPCSVKNIIILEGDHTQNPPEYFEGLKSVGQEVDEISVLSCNENLVDLNNTHSAHKQISIDIDKGTILCTDDSKYNDVQIYVYLERGKTYYFSKNGTTAPVQILRGIQMRYNYEVLLYTLTFNGEVASFTHQHESGWYTLHIPNLKGLVSEISLYREDNSELYISHQSNKKRILYYNDETQAWEKPVLREWDTIEKRGDKYYYIKRSKEVVLTGSEKISTDATNNVNTQVFLFSIDTSDRKEIAHSIKQSSIVICNNFSTNYTAYDVWNVDNIECISITEKPRIRISKSKASTVEEFKTWLQANPTTVVYQLTQEEVYECTNIDLITYANETNYVVNSGAITPKSTLKVMCNINNVVRELQQKVSNLENYIQHVMIDALNNALNE